MERKQLLKLFKKVIKRQDREPDTPDLLPEQDIEDIRNLFQGILEARYEPDYDGSVPVEFDLVDRSRYERVHYGAIIYDHKETFEYLSPEDVYRANISTALMNLGIAAEKVRVLQSLENTRRNTEKLQKSFVRHEDCSYLAEMDSICGKCGQLVRPKEARAI